jgi:hypothetical protein
MDNHFGFDSILGLCVDQKVVAPLSLKRFIATTTSLIPSPIVTLPSSAPE